MIGIQKARNLNLDDSDLKQNEQKMTFVDEIDDFKMDSRIQVIETKVLNYFLSYPNFSKGLFTNKHILKLCNVVEKFSYKSAIDKKQLVLKIMKSLALRNLTDAEIKLINGTIEFLHKSKLIKVSLVLKIYHTLCSFFR